MLCHVQASSVASTKERRQKMSRKHPLMPKGRACRVDLLPEYKEGQLSEVGDRNPYDPWGDDDEYCRWYAWGIGIQERDKL
jgi:hypothetical protein